MAECVECKREHPEPLPVDIRSLREDDCRFCQGKGYQVLGCNTCGGLKEKIECPVCKGAGKLNGIKQ
jgi:hypothetical protein